MDLMSFLKLPLSVDQGWPELARRRPEIIAVFGFLVLPLSLLPPAMVYFAGTHYPEIFGPSMRGLNWAAIARGLFFAEIGTFLAMGWLIKQVAESHAFAVGCHDAYLLAAVVLVPMWLSSLALLIPNVAFNGVISLSAIVLSCALLYQGVEAFGRKHEEIVAAVIVQIVIGALLIPWALLFAMTLL